MILERGQTIDRFVVLGLVGRGGMGEVYAAYDPELDRKVAIKLLRARGDAADQKTRLLREAQAIAKLQHPNVVVVYDVGTFGDNVFIAMEFVEGRTVGGWLSAGAGRRTRREILDVYLAAGRGLAAAHAAGLVHRDFKPDNVMVTNDGQVRVMDFGLARHVGEGGAPEEAPPLPVSGAEDVGDTFDPALDPEATVDLRKARDTGPISGKYLSLKLTQTGAMLGTPAYMAPEQFAVRPTDARTDQFSFCVALFEALYGARPFEGETFLALMTSVTTGKVSPVPAKTHVPGWMRRVLLRGLATEPGARWGSMAELLAALETDPTVRARRVAVAVAMSLLVGATALAARKVTGTHEAMCGGAAAKWAGVWAPGGEASPRNASIHRAFLATGLPYAEQAWRGASRYLDDYAARWGSAYRDACEATHVRGEQSAEVLDLRMGCLRDRLAAARALTDVFASANGAAVDNAVSAAAALPRLDRCADVPLLKATIQPPDDEAVRKRVVELEERTARLAAVTSAGQCAAAEKEEPALVADARAVGYRPVLAEALDAAAHMADFCVEENLGIERFREAYSIALASRNDEVAADAAASLSCFMLRNQTKDIAAAQLWVEIGRAMVDRIGGQTRLAGMVSEGQASIFRHAGRYAESIEAWRRAAAILAPLGPEHPEALSAANDLALTLEEAGRLDEARVQFEALLSTSERVLGAEHPKLTFPLNNLGEVLSRLGRYGEARAAFERALRIWRRSGSDPFYISYGLTGLGLAQLADGHAREAIGPLTEALAIRVEKKAGPGELGETRFALARALWSKPEERARALALARDARDDYRRVADAASPAPDIAAWLRAPSVAAPANLALAARTAGPSESPDR
ncbi:MAG TPA: serine/threonine-protein kinase [Polyangia bacterium]|nr:serine/threonine-protein kinase [Polyangia bacterium]